MSEDRPIHTDALATLGTIIDEKQGRDAIHIAVEPAVAGGVLCAGMHVGRLPDGRYGLTEKPVGIVDPFLTGMEGVVTENQRFWLLVYPRTITSLRHVWEHPDFPGRTVPFGANEHELAIRAICVELGCRYEELMDHTNYWLEYDDYWSDGGRWEGEHLPDEFWPHYIALTGKKIPDAKQHSFFSCSC